MLRSNPPGSGSKQSRQPKSEMCYDCIDEETLDDARRELHGEPSPVRSQTYIFACTLDKIPANGSRGWVLVAAKTEIALFNIRGTVYAINNICPHEHSPLLAEGRIDKDALTVACPLHGWTYSLIDGRSVVGNSRIRSYDVKVIGDEVWVEEPLEDHTSSVTWIDLPSSES